MKSSQTNSNELYHFGVMGMKWGVRRYQNYDGSYTQKGLEHYRHSLKRYEDKDAEYKLIKKAKKTGASISRDYESRVKNERKVLKRQLKADYKQLARDKKADQGKRLYNSGRTITGNSNMLAVAEYAAIGGGSVAGYLAKNGKMKEAKYVATATVGLEVVNGLLGLRNYSQAKKLRAYYSHNRNYRKDFI